MMKKTLVIITISLMLSSCAHLKKVGRTINDIASALCIVFGEENEESLQGVSPEEWCAIHDNLKPFIDYVMTAKQAAGASALGNDEPVE